MTLHLYLDSIKALNRNMKLYIASLVLFNVSWSINEVLYSLYLQNLGFDNTHIGRIIAMFFWAAIFFGIPMGILSDRIGRRKGLLLGLAACAVTAMMRIFLVHPATLLVSNFLYGTAALLYSVSLSPFVAEQVNPRHRTIIFPIISAVQMGVAVLGFSFGGILPDLLYNQGIVLMLGQRYTLVLGTLFSALSMIPILRIAESQPSMEDSQEEEAAQGSAHTVSSPQKKRRWQLPPSTELQAIMRIVLPTLINSAGAGMVIPFVGLFLRAQHNASTTQIGLIQALGQLSIVIATVLGPFVVSKLGLVQSVSLLQLLSVPFLLLLANSPWLSMALVGLLLRGGLMNAATPMVINLQMNQVSAGYRGLAVSCVDMANSLGRAAVLGLAGTISQSHGFPFVYNIGAAFYFTAALLFYVLNRNATSNQE